MTLATLLIVLVAGGMGYIRFAPVDVARWHVDLAQGDPAQGMQVSRGGATIAAQFPQETAAEVLARLDAIALRTARTRRLAGSPDAGLITWETRSAFWGFPDYTTAAATDGAQGAVLTMTARLRFGSSDFGVNAARLTGWLQLLRGDSAVAAGLSG